MSVVSSKPSYDVFFRFLITTHLMNLLIDRPQETPKTSTYKGKSFKLPNSKSGGG